jgi:type IV secretory pathway VirB2 component (pilin)
MKMFKHFNHMLFLAVIASPAFAGTDIGAPSSGFFAKMGKWLQEIVDFLEGPFGLFVCVAGLAMALLVWAVGTKSGEGLGMLGRVTIAVLLIINIPALVVSLQAL